MDKNKIIIIGVFIFFLFMAIFGVFWLLKNGIPDFGAITSVFKKPVQAPAEQAKEGVGPGEKAALGSAPDVELFKQAKEYYASLVDKINGAKSLCEKADDFSRVTKEYLNSFPQKEVQGGILSAAGGYFTCEAVQKKTLAKCDYLKNLNSNLFESCVMTAVTVRLEQEKCSSAAVSLCRGAGLLTAADCAGMCEVYVKDQLSGCESLKNESNLYKACLAVAKNDVNLCGEINDAAMKESCVDDYYLKSAVKNSDGSLIDKMSAKGFTKLYAQAAVVGDFSCQKGFSQFVNKDACVTALVGDLKKEEETAAKLKEEISAAERALPQ